MKGGLNYATVLQPEPQTADKMGAVYRLARRYYALHRHIRHHSSNMSVLYMAHAQMSRM